MKITYRLTQRVGELEVTKALDFEMDEWQQGDVDRFVDFAREKLGGDGEVEVEVEVEDVPDGQG